MIPHVVYAKYVSDYKIYLVFQDGKNGTVNLEKFLKGEVFEPLKDKNKFSDFHLDGFTVAWDNQADIAPETLYEEVLNNKQ